jgi:hypothetical protein
MFKETTSIANTLNSGVNEWSGGAVRVEVNHIEVLPGIAVGIHNITVTSNEQLKGWT